MQRVRPDEIDDIDKGDCPVCGKHPKMTTGNICPICGWEFDMLQQDEKDYEGGANELSLNQYKKEYKERLKKNPKYMWYKYLYTKRGY